MSKIAKNKDPKRPVSPRRRFTEEFKEEAVQMMLDGRRTAKYRLTGGLCSRYLERSMTWPDVDFLVNSGVNGSRRNTPAV